MDVSLFDYELPAERIAQQPKRPRDHSRLLVLYRASGAVEHRRFHNIGEYLKPGDVLVLNDTKVFRARLRGTREGSGSRVDVLLLREKTEGVWESLVRPGRRVKVGCHLSFGHGVLKCRVAAATDFGGRVLDFTETPGLHRGSFLGVLRDIGELPVPPYIKAPITDDEWYQTVYAEQEGSVAAPTAGFHFTDDLLHDLERSQIRFARITLHVGIGTFRPIKTEMMEDHVMHEEYYSVGQEAVEAMLAARRGGHRIISVGTTTVRALESCGSIVETPVAASGWTSLFIQPGHSFRQVDALITNFHLPRSTLLVLACAFGGRDRILNAYRKAIEHDYRFYSFGDAMLIV